MKYIILEFHKRFKDDGEENFRASDGRLNILGEKLLADSSEIETFDIQMRGLILEHGLTSD